MALNDIAKSVTDVIHSLDVVGAQMIGVLGGVDGFGFKLLGVLFAIMFFYHMIMFVLEANGRIMIDITKLIITWAILASMLIGWTKPMGGDGPTSSLSVSAFFLEAIPSIADSFAANPTATIVEKHSSAVMNIFQTLTPTEPGDFVMKKMISIIPGVNMISNAVDWFSGNDSAEKAGNAMDNASIISVVISSILLAIAAFFVLWSLLTFVFIINAGTIMMYVGLALGPVLIPFLLIDKLSFLFDGWLRFMISASLYKVIAVLVALLTLGTIDAIGVYAKTTSTGDESIIFLSLMVLFYAMLAKQIMGLADNMASTIATGGANSGGTGDSGAMLAHISRRSKSKPKEEPKSKD